MNEKMIRDVKDKIFYRVINTELNRMLIDSAPSIEYPEYGVSKVFYAFLNGDEFGASTLLINYPVAEFLGYSVEELNHFAERNTFKLFPTTAIPFAEVKEAMPEFDGEDWSIGLDMEFFVLTNDYYNKGAHAMFNTDFLDGFAKATSEEKLYIIPTTEHELLLVRGSQVKCCRDVQMMKDSLRSFANDDEFHSNMLSYECMVYDVETRQYSVA